jgi:hypothetical protein
MLQLATSFPTIAGTAYFLYIGQVARTIKLNKVYFVTSAVGAGALTQEFGIATTPNAPDGTIQPLTIRAIDTTATDYTGSVGRYSNGGNLAHTPPVGSHIWVFARFQPATTQPGIANGLACDIGQFSVFTFASVGTPLVLGQVIPTPASVSVTLTTAVAPNLILSV